MATIRDFNERHRAARVRPIQGIAARWERQAHFDQLFATTMAGGITLGDLMVGDGLRDQISPELFDAFHALMGEKAGSYEEVRRILIARLETGPEAVFGLINKIKGQVGENWFVDQAAALGSEARLAELGNQEAWDVAVDHADGVTQYVQVKMYQDPVGIVRHIQDVQAKLCTPGRIMDGDVPVEQIDFAIPADTLDQVRERLQEIGLEVNLIPMAGSAREAGDVVQAGFDSVGLDALEHLFGDLLCTSASAVALHGLVQGFLIYKGSKAADRFLSETVTQTGLTVSGVAAGMTVEAVLSKMALLGGVPTFVLVLTTSLTTRAVLRRIISRRDYVDWLQRANRELELRTMGGGLRPASL